MPIDIIDVKSVTTQSGKIEINESHHDFREAIKNAFTRFRNQKIAEHLPLANEQYLFNKQMGFEVEAELYLDDDIRNIYVKQILHGREVNGEPRDFNF